MSIGFFVCTQTAQPVVLFQLLIKFAEGSGEDEQDMPARIPST